MTSIIKDGITLGIALLGAALGLINLWRAFDRDRICVRVSPRGYINSNGTSGICIEITNLGFIAVTISMAGFDLLDRKQLIYTNALITPGDKLPLRLEPRSSCTVYMPPGFEKDKRFDSVRVAFAQTACGKRFTGKSPYLKSCIATARGG